MPVRPIVDNIVTGAEAAGSGAANRTRSVNAARSRVNQMGDVLGITSDILKNEEVMKTLPEDLQARLRLGEPAAMLEATMHVMRRGGIPKNIPRDRALSKFPGGEAGFQMGKDGGRVPVASAGELIPAGQRGLVRNPGAEAGFQMGGDLPPQNFDPTGLVPRSGGPLSIRTQPRRRGRGLNPLGMAAGAAATLAAGKYIYDTVARDSDPSSVDVEPEARDEGASQEDSLPDVEQQMTELQATAARLLDGLQRSPQAQPEGQYGGRRPPRPNAELWATQGERSMDYALDPNSPQGRTLSVLLDAGISPERAEGIARGIVSMTQMEHDAVIGNGAARKQRMQDGIDARRRERMGAY